MPKGHSLTDHSHSSAAQLPTKCILDAPRVMQGSWQQDASTFHFDGEISRSYSPRVNPHLHLPREECT